MTVHRSKTVESRCKFENRRTRYCKSSVGVCGHRRQNNHHQVRPLHFAGIFVGIVLDENRIKLPYICQKSPLEPSDSATYLAY